MSAEGRDLPYHNRLSLQYNLADGSWRRNSAPELYALRYSFALNPGRRAEIFSCS